MARLLCYTVAISVLSACLASQPTWYEDRCLRLGSCREAMVSMIVLRATGTRPKITTAGPGSARDQSIDGWPLPRKTVFTTAARRCNAGSGWPPMARTAAMVPAR